MDMRILTSLYLGGIDLVVEFQDEQDTLCDQLLGQRLLVRVESNAVVVDLQGRDGGHIVGMRRMLVALIAGTCVCHLPLPAWPGRQGLLAASAWL